MVKTSYIGQQAELSVAKLLTKDGHKIIAQNWKRPQCEIDIISSKHKTIFFTEVKYRSTNAQGDGFGYITPSKYRQIELAAQAWIYENGWTGDCQLMVASVTGEHFERQLSPLAII